MGSSLETRSNAFKKLFSYFRKIYKNGSSYFDNILYSILDFTSTLSHTNRYLFRIDATYEMRTTEYGEICISIDDLTIAERAFKRNGKMGKDSKVGERQREIECVCASVDRN